jgi:hypothetical protein
VVEEVTEPRVDIELSEVFEMEEVSKFEVDVELSEVFKVVEDSKGVEVAVVGTEVSEELLELDESPSA